MSRAVVQAARLKPEIRLAQAVSEFEADLSSQQKAAFQASRARALSSPPAPSDVMRLTAEIDKCASYSRRCVGPRAVSFLQAVQQFASLGDIIIGGSQNLIACGVWALVRTSLLSVVLHSSFVEKISTLLMVVGRSAPRYQQMALIYPHSKVLQSNLSEYFIVVVHLCHQFLKFTQKSRLNQLVSSLSDAETQKYQSELDRWANAIKEEVNSLLARKIEEEGQENSRFRALSSKFIQGESQQQGLRTKLRLLNLCSTYDYETTWKQIHKAGNSTLFIENSIYEDWKCQRSSSSTLIYTGKLGSGKSVLLASIVDDLHISIDDQSVPVTYFFCRHDISESLKARTILGSLARQLLCQVSDLTDTTSSLDESSLAVGSEKLVQIIQHTFSSGFKAYFILDGLDECDSAERTALIKALSDLQSSISLLLCISSRPEPENPIDLKSGNLADVHFCAIPEQNPDIEAFIEAELESCVTSQRLVLGDSTLILEIQNALTSGSQGMFLWVVLQIASLCTMESDFAIRQALANLPKDLSETFSRLLQRSAKSGKHNQRHILELITIAIRPLTTGELREALSVTPDDTEWDPNKLLNDVHSTLTQCGGLVTVDEEELTVRLVHHSVKQFLYGDAADLASGILTTEYAHKTMTRTILTYLNYGIFDTQLSTEVVPQLPAEMIPNNIIHSTLGTPGKVRLQALKLLKSRNKLDFNISKILAEKRSPSRNPGTTVFHFHDYAQSFWLKHRMFFLEEDENMCRLLGRLIRKGLLEAGAIYNDQRTGLIWAAQHGHSTLFKFLVQTCEANVNLKDDSGQTLFRVAIANGQQEIVKILLEEARVDLDKDLKIYDPLDPLTMAIACGRDAIAQLLLDVAKANPDSVDPSYSRTPLTWAVIYGREKIVKRLLRIYAIRIDDPDTFGRTAFSYAVYHGIGPRARDPETTRMFDWRPKEGLSSTIPLATQESRETIFKLLLNTGKVNVDRRDNLGRTPLWWAASGGHDVMVRLLLETGEVDVNARDGDRLTPLVKAMAFEHDEVVKLLLATGMVDMRSEGGPDIAPLWWAVENNFDGIVRRLLTIYPADDIGLNSANHLRQSPLMLAIQQGFTVIAKQLLATGRVDLYKKDNEGRSTLQWILNHLGLDLLLSALELYEKESRPGMLRSTILTTLLRSHDDANVKKLLEVTKVNVVFPDVDGILPMEYTAEVSDHLTRLLRDHANKDLSQSLS